MIILDQENLQPYAKTWLLSMQNERRVCEFLEEFPDCSTVELFEVVHIIKIIMLARNNPPCLHPKRRRFPDVL